MTRQKMNEELEKQLKNELLEACKKCRDELNYNPTYFLKMLYEKGAVESAKQLVNSPTPAEGFTRLWEERSLPLSVEAHVIKEKYRPLFTPEEIKKARNRLEEYGYESSL